MQATRIISSHDYDNVVRFLSKFKKGDTEGFLNRIDPTGNLVINVVQINTRMDCDVLIIEDNPEHIIKYFRILERFPMVKHIIVCTKKVAFDHVIDFITDLERIKLVIMDFDLDAGVDNDTAATNAQDIYNKICNSITNNNLKVIGLTGFENNYRIRNYKILEAEMKAGNDYVFNKDFLDNKNIELFENILRNVPTINIDWDKRPKKEETVTPEKSISKPVDKNQSKPVYSPFNQRKISAAKHLLDRINNAVINYSKEKVTINYTDKNFLKLIPNSKGKPMKHHQSLAEVFEDKIDVIKFLLQSPDYAKEWEPFRNQIDQGMFSKQLQESKK